MKEVKTVKCPSCGAGIKLDLEECKGKYICEYCGTAIVVNADKKSLSIDKNTAAPDKEPEVDDDDITIHPPLSLAKKDNSATKGCVSWIVAILVIGLIVVGAIFLFRGEIDERFIGTWQREGSNAQLILEENGDAMRIDHMGRRTAFRNWQVRDGVLYLHLMGGERHEPWSFVIEEDRITLTNNVSGQVFDYIRQ